MGHQSRKNRISKTYENLYVMRSKYKKNKIEKSIVDGSQHQNINHNYNLSKEEITKLATVEERSKNLSVKLDFITSEFEKAEIKYRKLTEKVAEVHKEYPVPGSENSKKIVVIFFSVCYFIYDCDLLFKYHSISPEIY